MEMVQGKSHLVNTVDTDSLVLYLQDISIYSAEHISNDFELFAGYTEQAFWCVDIKALFIDFYMLDMIIF